MAEANEVVMTLLRHNAWATRVLIEDCVELDEERFHRRFEIGPGSLHDTLVHICGAMGRWADRILDEPPRPTPEGGEGGEGGRYAATDLLAMLDEADRDLVQSARRVIEQQRLGEMMEFHDGGDVYRFTRLSALIHVATHGVHHRAQVLNMRRRLGLAPLELDAIEAELAGEGGGGTAGETAMNRCETLAHVVEMTRVVFDRFLAGFDATHHTRKSPGLPNHPAWTLGHCALYLHRMAEKLDGRAIPETEFVTGDGTGGGGDRYDTESVCFGSRPVDEPARYPSPERCIEIYRSACDRLSATVRDADEADLDRMVRWGNGDIAQGDLVVHVCFHAAMHVGQIVDLRRVMGMGSVIG